MQKYMDHCVIKGENPGSEYYKVCFIYKPSLIKPKQRPAAKDLISQQTFGSHCSWFMPFMGQRFFNQVYTINGTIPARNRTSLSILQRIGIIKHLLSASGR